MYAIENTEVSNLKVHNSDVKIFFYATFMLETVPECYFYQVIHYPFSEEDIQIQSKTTVPVTCSFNIKSALGIVPKCFSAAF